MPDISQEERNRIYEEEKARRQAFVDDEFEKGIALVEESRLRESAQAQALRSNLVTYLTIAIFLVVVIGGFNIYRAAGGSTGDSAKPVDYTPTPAPPDPEPTKSFTDVMNDLEEKERLEKAKVRVKPGSKWIADEYEHDRVTGSIENKSDRPVSYWAVTAEFLDKNGKIVDSAYTNDIQTLHPGAEKRFEVLHSGDSKQKSVRVYVSEVTFKD